MKKTSKIPKKLFLNKMNISVLSSVNDKFFIVGGASNACITVTGGCNTTGASLNDACTGLKPPTYTGCTM
jgi:hypothetical protein